MQHEQKPTEPFFYEIQVSGRIDTERAAWLGIMAVEVKSMQEGSVTSLLTGQVLDQAALFGILSRVRDLGLKLISVHRVGRCCSGDCGAAGRAGP